MAAMSEPPVAPLLPHSHSPWRQSLNDILAGTAGGLCTVLVGHPLDTIKVRLQTASSVTKMSMVDCIRLTLREEGIRGFYKGMQSPLAGEGFFNAAQFFIFGKAKRLLLDQHPTENPVPGGPLIPRTDLSVGEYFIAGAATGFFSTFVETPIDLFKSQLQTQIFRPKPLFTTFPQSLAYVWRIGGIRGCYQGLGATFLRTTPATACYFGVYEWTKTLQLQPGQVKADLSHTALLIAGGCGGVSYWLSSFPLDSIKSSMQSDAVIRTDRKYRSIIDCVKQLYSEGGIGRFYRGLAPCLIRSFPANAACFYTYEKALQYLDKI